jgi:excisionase family DNA binding protein
MKEERSINPFDQLQSRLNEIENLLKDIQDALLMGARQEKKFYSISEAAQKLKIAQITLYRNIQSGKIPVKRIGARILIPGSFIEK